MRVIIFGETGLLGTELVEIAEQDHMVFKPRGFKERYDNGRVNLLKYEQVYEYINWVSETYGKPDVVINAAGDVGGITNNINTSFEKLYNNSLIGLNVVKACKELEIKKLINIGSACNYPKTAKQPFEEISIFDGTLEKTNQYYSYGKLVTLKAIEASNKQYNTNFYSLICPNIYGISDSFSAKGHVIPQLLKKFHRLKQMEDWVNVKEVYIQGNEETEREFIYSEDLAHIVLWFAEYIDLKDIKEVTDLDMVNITGRNNSIGFLVDIIQSVVGTKFNTTYTGVNIGISKKSMSSKIFDQIYDGNTECVPLIDGIKYVYNSVKEKL